MNKTFEEYLKDIHSQDYIGTNDDMAGSFDSWFENLSGYEIVEYAEDWGKDLLAGKNKKPF